MPPTIDESRTALVRRARTDQPELAATYPDARCELDFTTPLELLVATILSAQTTDKRVNMVTPMLFARYPHRGRVRRRRPGRARGADQADRLLPGQDRHLIKLGAALVRAVRRRGPGRLAELVTLPGRRSQDGERRAGQRVRRARHHRRHPLRPAGPPVRLDDRDRPGQGRAEVGAMFPRGTGPCSATA